MKHFSKLAAILAVLALVLACIGCSNDSDDNSSGSATPNNNSSVSSTIVGSYTCEQKTLVFKSDGTFKLTNTETTIASGTYTVSGTTATLTDDDTSFSGTTPDDWKTFVLTVQGRDMTFTKQ
ncbi:MAG: hypothetical protein PUI78_02960 [Treponema sp.]|nr:hypothetical protein [Treponema sp.]